MALQIIINGKQVKSTERVADVRSVSVNIVGFRVMVERPRAKVIVSFVYDCVQRCTGVIMFNNLIIRKEDVKEIKF